MTDVRQFGDLAARSFDCARCEAMLADAVDGALPVEDQQFFDTHIADCPPCAHLLAEARRGAAWLEMLRTPAPEPPPALLEKILAQTSWNQAPGALHPVPLAHPAPAMASGYGNVLPFPRRAAAAMRTSAFGRMMFEPRLAMTAAMAFLSIALTMDLMGVNPLALRARDLSPSGLHRAFADLDARAVQYYEGLRVVYELESRVHDFQNVQGNTPELQPQSQAPAASATDRQAQPSDINQIDNPADQTDQPAQLDDNQDKATPNQQPAQPKTAPSGGVSRRDETRPAQTRGTLAAFSRSNDADRQAYDAAVDDATHDTSEDILGGISSATYLVGPQSVTIPFHRRTENHAERRAA